MNKFLQVLEDPALNESIRAASSAKELIGVVLIFGLSLWLGKGQVAAPVAVEGASDVP
jgi:hypothetical protein